MLSACDAERDQAMARLCGQGYAAPAQSSELSRLRKSQSAMLRVRVGSTPKHP